MQPLLYGVHVNRSLKSTLTPAELRQVRKLIKELEAEHFDAALAVGAEAGVFDQMLAKAEADRLSGNTDDVL